jgi:hypothetical protein
MKYMNTYSTAFDTKYTSNTIQDRIETNGHVLKIFKQTLHFLDYLIETQVYLCNHGGLLKKKCTKRN